MSLASYRDERVLSRNGIATPVEAGALRKLVNRLDPHWHSDWAWENYGSTIEAMATTFSLRRLCEIGGGRDPYFDKATLDRLGVSLTINDISREELDKAPAGFDTACFSICGDLDFGRSAPEPGSYDLMFSRMVFEHVPDVAKAWRNIHTLLSPGGVALAFNPTLYAWPFLINHLIPESVSSRIVQALYKNRAPDGDDPKFPAVYDWCFGDERRLAPMLHEAGFSEIEIVPFWGTRYLERFPVFREIDHGLSRLSAIAGWRKATSYAYVIVRK